MQHSVIAPSSAGQWVHCPASVKAQRDVKDVDNPNRTEGQALHAVGYNHFNNKPTVEGDTVEGVIITNEMLQRVGHYTSYIDSLTSANPHCEERVNCLAIHEDCFGTPDLWAYSDGILTIADYKDGYLEVSPCENWQLICYYAGILPLLPQNIENTLIVRFVIIQPRSYGEPVKTWETQAVNIRQHVNRLVDSANQVVGDYPLRQAGLHCRYCKAMFACSDNTLEVQSVACGGMYTQNPLVNNIYNELEFLQYAQKMIKFRIMAVEAEAFRAIKDGKTVSGFEVGTGRGKLAWKEDVNVKDLGLLTGVPLSVEKLITPTQAKTAGVHPGLLKQYTEYKPGKAFLKPILKAKEVFGSTTK